MEDLIREQTDESPEVHLSTSGKLLFKGVSILENINLFYNDIFDWLTLFEKNLPASIHLTFEVEYINTSSTKAYIEIVKKINSFRVTCSDIKITWRYQTDDEDNLDLGKDMEYWAKTEFIFETY